MIQMQAADDVFLILGIANGGLFLARQLRKQWSESRIYAIGDSDDIGRYSNTLDCFYPASNEDDVVKRINEVTDLVKGKRVHAFMCSNTMLEWIVFHHPELFKTLEFENDFDLYRRIVDKAEVDKLCRSLSIPRPEEYPLNDSPDSLIEFPVIVKPLEKMSTIGASKCAYLSTQDELQAYLDKMACIGIDPKAFICQQCVKGDNRWEYGYGGYFRAGIALVDIFFHQFIQVPQGLCCYCREITEPFLRNRILEIVKPFLKETRYNGFLEFDIKQDEDSHEFYLLDVNPRPWRSVDMLAGKLGNSTVFSPKATNELVIWRYPYRELLRRKNKKNVSYKLSRLIAPGRFVTLFALKDKADRMPTRKQNNKDRKDMLRLVRKKLFK